MAVSSLSLLHSLVSASAGVTFVPQADRRQLPDRRDKWRGGRRISDRTQFAQHRLVNESRHGRRENQNARVDAPGS